MFGGERELEVGHKAHFLVKSTLAIRDAYLTIWFLKSVKSNGLRTLSRGPVYAEV